MTHRTLIFVASLAVGGALAQAPAPVQQPQAIQPAQPMQPQLPMQAQPQARAQPPMQTGFFRPSADVSLTAPRATPQPMHVIESRSQAPFLAPVETALEPSPASPVAALRWTEEQMDRSTMENERARQQGMTMQPGVGAAFDGTTSDRNR
jgi:hypothetical protein